MRDLSLLIPTGLSRTKPILTVSILRTNVSILVSIFILGLVYLFVVNSLGTKGYEIRKLEQLVRQLESDQKTLQLQASDLQSINRIQIEAQKLNYVPATNVTYLKDSDFALK